MTTFDDSAYLRRSPVGLLIDAQRRRPNQPLLAWPGASATVAEFVCLARRCATDLAVRFGVVAGDRVALVGRNSIERLAWQYGAYWIGAIEVSVNFELNGSMLAHVLRDSDPQLVLVDDELCDAVRGEAAGIRVEAIASPNTVATDVDSSRLDEAESRLAADGLATLLYTSGTTGPSKGVMLARGYFANHAQTFVDMLGLCPDDVGYFVLPFFHVDGHILLTSAIVSGSSLFFTPRFSVRRFWSEISANGCTWWAGVGSMLAAAATAEPPAPEDIPLRRIMAAPVTDNLYEHYEDRLGIPILSLYGQTEADAVTYERADQRRRGSAGKPSPAFEVGIVAPDGRRLRAGAVGEICHRPRFPTMTMRGYWRRPEATIAAWTDLWYHTGDLGAFDDDGFLFYRGRMTDSLRRRGENISAYELESVLREVPGVTDAAAVAVVDELGGEDEIKVLVTCETGHELDAVAFFAHCTERLPRFAQPRFVEQVSATAFVRSPGTGVIQKHRLSTSVTGDAVLDRNNFELPTGKVG